MAKQKGPAFRGESEGEHPDSPAFRAMMDRLGGNGDVAEDHEQTIPDPEQSFLPNDADYAGIRSNAVFERDPKAAARKFVIIGLFVAVAIALTLYRVFG